MLWKHTQPFNPHLAHTMTKVERHGGQVELEIFRVAHHQERVLLPLRDSMGGSDEPLLLPITLATAGALGLIGLILAFRVTMGRGKHKVYLGDGGNPDMIVRKRTHASFVEYAPLMLVLL